MRLENLQVRHLRSLTEVRLDLAPGINLVIGPNGAGKTSVLEAAFLLSHAHSFRSGSKDALIQRGAGELSVFAEVRHANDQVDRVGLGRDRNRWNARLDGLSVSLGDLVRRCAVVCFEPGSHALIAGGAEERRRYLDWGVFHVEQNFLVAWRRYQRALKQRNSLLRSSAPAEEALYTPWELELGTSAAQIDQSRTAYLDALRPLLALTLAQLLPELGGVELRYRRGWPDDEALEELLRAQRGRDIARTHTTQGAHRADWGLAFEYAPAREHLSRGQEKLVALACVLAQAELYARARGESPVICLDDLASELDQGHQAAVVEHLLAGGAQILLSGTEVPTALREIPSRVFHVEQGRIAALL